MPVPAEWALQRAVYDALVTSSSLVAALGGAHVFDRVPRSQRPPYIMLGDGETANWTTATEDGAEHLLTLNIVSDNPGRKQAVTIAGLVRDVLNGTQLTLEDHYLVNLQFGSTTVRRNKHDESFTAVVRFRAVTEPQ